MSVELAVVAPALVLLLLLVGAGGRVVEAQGHLDGAARDAARAASLGRSPAQAAALARQAAQADLLPATWCARGSVQVSVQGFPAESQAFGTAGDVTVVVRCVVPMSPFRVLGFRPVTVFTGEAVAPLDPYMCRDGSC